MHDQQIDWISTVITRTEKGEEKQSPKSSV